MLPLIIKSLQHRKLKVRKMAAVALRNFTKVGNPKQVALAMCCSLKINNNLFVGITSGKHRVLDAVYHDA